MADKKETAAAAVVVETEIAPADTTLALTQTMARMLDHMEAGRVQQIPISKVKNCTPWNPEGKKNHERVRLTRTTFQNSVRVTAERLTEDEIRAFNKLKPGRYGPERKWVVVKRGDDSVDVRYPNKSIEERMELQKYAVGGIIGILNTINEQYAERLDRRKRNIISEDEVLD
jgi:hypothetical protein